MVLRPDRLDALRREELVALERGDHLVDVVAVALLIARTIICAATKPSGVKMSGTWLRLRICVTSQSFTLFFGAV